MKINIIGPSCVGKSTLAKSIAQKYNWKHFDLDLVFIDRDYLAETKIFKYCPKSEYKNKIDGMLAGNKDWIIEGVYLVDEVLQESDLIIFINLPILVPLNWQWKRYFTDSNQRNTYGFLNNVGLTKEIFNEYFQKKDVSNYNDETSFYMRKYDDVLRKYKNKLKIISNIDDLKKIKTSGDYSNL